MTIRLAQKIYSVEKKDDSLIPCACGCGELIEPVSINPRAPNGKKSGRPKRFKLGHHLLLRTFEQKRIEGLPRLENHWNWKGGRIMSSRGYIQLLRPDHPFHDSRNYVQEHRLVWEQHHNAILLPWADIHHINGIKTDNTPENLQAFMKDDHTKYHHLIKGVIQSHN